MNPEDLDSLAEYSSPLLRGSEAVITITRPDLESNSYLSQLFALSGESSRRLTHNWRDFAPEVCSNWSGYLSAAKKEAGQLYVGSSLETAHRITDNHLGVSEFALDDQGARALYVARVAEPGRYGQDDDIPAGEEAPRRITSAAYLSNGLGYTNDRPARAFLVDLVEPGLGKSGIAGGAEVPLSTLLQTPETDVHDPQFSLSGTRVSVVSSSAPDDGEPDLRSTVWLLSGDSPEALTLPRMSVNLHRWIDDETVLLVGNELTRDELDFVGQMPGLFVHDLTSGSTRRLTDPETVSVASIRPQIVGHGHGTAEDASVIAVVDTDGASRIMSIDLAAENRTLGELDFLTDDTAVVNGFDVDGDSLVWTGETPTNPAVLNRVRLADVGKTATDDGGAVRAHPAPANSVVPQLLRVDGEGGSITGWLAKPSGQGPFPVILNIHGGPFAQYTHGWFDETQVLTSAGYAVVYANPRGSGGRTRAWGTAVQGNMAAPAMADVLAVLDHALASDAELDSSRLGVQGGSYGGYLTAMITAADHRFEAAIVERGYLDPDSFVGTSDIGRFFTEEYTSRDQQAIARQSPLAHASQVRTPSLVMHSELDFRCPLEQAQQYYAALQRAGVDTELLIFPGENHELSRSGQPRHRRQRFEAMLDWWDQHLGGDVDGNVDDQTTSAIR
ncbi:MULTISPECIES: prolyl oligopeptidase family serine peptidase [Brevibacterium]|uniref:Dipeptidyl aminopeptidase/acylaminoacyl peptidase n=2 Tax=Brevibacterium antiquum TaxID=234835 RepID=A0A2H1HMB2_9MICO|nr:MULTISPECIES: prolyl oligopeptidase family serine peptidase [Brevibacterium]SMX64049.1 Dipeptidyl aminopeptidase/acylaminoacyl peptidase [Brevibacterium antiquum CNRZ 918]SMX64723.1 Dipeptidyl aminopeptidase/acylaminoacyl peptidase [Brevibacterium antiquum]HCG57377.1 S9 family peptidase [Brevibacterium sp.]